MTVIPALQRLKEIIGADVPDARLEENVAAFRGILVEIQKLRTLDLTEVHPPSSTIPGFHTAGCDLTRHDDPALVSADRVAGP